MLTQCLLKFQTRVTAEEDSVVRTSETCYKCTFLQRVTIIFSFFGATLPYWQTWAVIPWHGFSLWLLSPEGQGFWKWSGKKAIHSIMQAVDKCLPSMVVHFWGELAAGSSSRDHMKKSQCKRAEFLSLSGTWQNSYERCLGHYLEEATVTFRWWRQQRTRLYF